MKLLSFVIPAYNSEAYLEKCISSMLEPSVLPALEIIVVNDGSTDATEKIALRFCGQYPGTVRLITQKNLGHGGALNTGCAAAQGKYLKVIDADDWVESRSLPAFVKALEKCESDVVLTHYRTVDITTGEEKAWRCYPEAFGKAMTLGDVMGRWGDFDRALTFHGIAYRTDFYHRMGLKLSEHIFYEDHEFATFPCCHAETVTPLDIFLYVYRIGDGNQSVSDANQLKRISHVEAVLNRLLTEGEKLPPGAGRDYAAAKAQGLLMSYLTTALLVCPDKAQGRALAEKAVEALRTPFPENYRQIAGKYKALALCSRLNITGARFQTLLDNPIIRKIRGKHSFS